MSAYDETSTGRTDCNEPVDIALEIALKDASDDRVRELIREAQQHRERVAHEATDADVRESISAVGGDL